MEKQILYTRWIEIDGDEGITVVQSNVFPSQNKKTAAPTKADEIYTVETVDGYGARYHMPGFMDCTPWTVYPTETEALAGLDELYGDM